MHYQQRFQLLLEFGADLDFHRAQGMVRKICAASTRSVRTIRRPPYCCSTGARGANGEAASGCCRSKTFWRTSVLPGNCRCDASIYTRTASKHGASTTHPASYREWRRLVWTSTQWRSTTRASGRWSNPGRADDTWRQEGL